MRGRLVNSSGLVSITSMNGGDDSGELTGGYGVDSDLPLPPRFERQHLHQEKMPEMPSTIYRRRVGISR